MTYWTVEQEVYFIFNHFPQLKAGYHISTWVQTDPVL